ncbi:uncharacterized protein [Magallana gigas]|uniref:uncharacterized protein isoform X1 n=1 Tax=Magallana gigas TaxID=29159 RepID=UPI00334281C7
MDENFRESQTFWHQQAAIAAERNRELRFQHGTGPCNVFILDTSSSLGEEGFTQMKEAFTSIIDEYAKHPDIDENVAVIVCGRETKFQCHFSNHYEDVKHCLDDIEFGGPSPLFAAFILSTGCFVNGASHSYTMGDFHIHPRIVLISDGRPTDITAFLTEDSPSVESDNNKDHLLQFTRKIGKVHPIFCIPTGRHPDTTILEFICNQSRGGKVVNPHEARQFAKYSKNMKIAASLSYELINDGNDRERVLTSLVCKFPDGEFSEMDQNDIYEICSRKSLYVSFDRIKDDIEERLDTFEERDPRMPPMGTRVKRGRDWKWKFQDRFGPGTVIGHSREVGWLTVEWDDGSRNCYRYGTTDTEKEKYDVQVCNEPRILGNESISSGCQVKRGPDWEWDDQDGGAGNIGSVVAVVGHGVVLVRWQNGILGHYRFGFSGKNEIQICDPFSPEAVRHREEIMRTAAQNYPFESHANSKEGYEKAKGSLDISGHKATSDMAKPILHVVKGKYFRNTSVSSDIETDGPSFTCAIGQWFWKDDTGKWNPYCTKMNAKINKCYKRDPKSTVVVNVQNQTYRVVMAKNIQINLASREVSEVKLVKNELDL